jgi:carbamoyltransferase
MPNVIGISAYFHDSAACLLQNGIVTAAAQEERFSRRKHDPSLPRQAFQYCLKEAGVTIANLDCVAYYEDANKKLERQIAQLWPKLPLPQMLRLWQAARRPSAEIREILGFEGRLEIVDHHQAHAASSYFLSGYPEAAIFTVDGVGEWATATFGRGYGNSLEILDEVRFPDSLGLLYSTVTNYLGFGVNDGEYKVMGLAPYGTPRYVSKVRDLLQSQGGSQFRLDLDYFDFGREDRMYTDRFVELFAVPPREPNEPIRQFHEDMASSLQVVLEDVLLEKVRHLHDIVPVDYLCMAGGVALNCVANSRILREGPFKRLFVQPAAGDAGGAVGAAALGWLRITDAGLSQHLKHVYLGPSYTLEEVAALLRSAGIQPRDYRGLEEELLAVTVDRLAEGKVVAWFQGRMEFGPRSLGARSILADPRDSSMRDRINALVKKREAFRPFAPAVLDSSAGDHFDLDHSSPFMLETCQVISPLPLPAITHVDGSARVQTVSTETNARFARLLQAFGERTGCPILLNTSFNMKDEPIVCSPSDALVCFARSNVDTLVIEDFVIDRDAVGPPCLAVLGACSQQLPSGISDSIYTFF